MHPLYQKPDDLTPLLQVCYDVAEEAHRGMVRTKQAGSIPYITHPSIVYKILRLVGIDDELTLAASFLHDVMEDCDLFKPDGALKKTLTEKFQAAGLADAGKTAYLISEICEELTNAERMAEGKRGWQWEHGHRLSARAKAVKIADQAASLVDDVLMLSDRPYEKLHKFNMKALECAKACSGSHELLDDVFKTIFKKAAFVLDKEKQGSAHPEAAEVRANFSLEAVLQEAKQLPIAKRDEPPVRWRRHPATKDANAGVLSMGITQAGDVCRFSMLVDPELDEASACNQPVGDLIQALEDTPPTRVTYQPLEVADGRVVRSFKLKPPMPLDTFIEKARGTDAIEDRFATIAATPVAGRTVS